MRGVGNKLCLKFEPHGKELTFVEQLPYPSSLIGFFLLIILVTFITGHLGVEGVVWKQGLTLISQPYRGHIPISQEETRKGQIPSPRPHSWEVAEPGLEQRV